MAIVTGTDNSGVDLIVGEGFQISGIVQGVGFRPTVWRLARECGITGRVWNDAAGVSIEAWGSKSDLDEFVARIKHEQPPLARIDAIKRFPLDGDIPGPDNFQIIESRGGEVRSGVTADAATCPACMGEVMDPDDRHYRYPFTNCTHCGPRLSIISAIPYDRANTSMAAFTMCEQCRHEYEDPTDRRFHAQPNACPDCGPQLWLESIAGKRVESTDDMDPIQTLAHLLKQGSIVAIKGIGGIHLACDAGNGEAVDRLRQRKHRYHKALALMAKDVAMVSRYALVGDDERLLLEDIASPIVILEAGKEQLASGIAPGQGTLGFMLPYTPLHHLLMQEMDRPVVMTSGNRSEEPQSIDNSDAHERLGQIADYYLLHDREIVNRLDDSVVRVMDSRPRFLRRARGYAPQALLMADQLTSDDCVLAMGGELKNTFCMLRQGRAIISQHMGDLEDATTFQDYRKNLELYRRLFQFDPDVIVVDSHPNYLSTQLGMSMAAELGLPLLQVQHHHAHIASCMAEHGLPGDQQVLGIALDGLGYGKDGSIWGGEFLLADYQGFERLAHFQTAPMLGGSKAIYEPWRNTLAQMINMDLDRVERDYADLEIIGYLQQKPITTLRSMAEKGLNSPQASSAGRLFDAVAAALGVCRDEAGYEGQAAIELEAMASICFCSESANAYEFELTNDVLRWNNMWHGLLHDLRSGVEKSKIAARFHHTVAKAVSAAAKQLCEDKGLDVVVLSGGVFQNRLLLERCAHLLRREGLQLLLPERLPVNDGGLSLGQAVVAQVARVMGQAGSAS